MQWQIKEAGMPESDKATDSLHCVLLFCSMSYNLSTTLDHVEDTFVKSFELVKSFQVYQWAMKLYEHGFGGWERPARFKTAMHCVVESLGCNKSRRHNY